MTMAELPDTMISSPDWQVSTCSCSGIGPPHVGLEELSANVHPVPVPGTLIVCPVLWKLSTINTVCW